MEYILALEILADNEQLVEQYQKEMDKVVEQKGCEWYDIDLDLVKFECMKLKGFDEKVWEAFELDNAWSE